MPELPEVETVRAGLAPALINATITDVEILDVRSLKRHSGSVADFKHQLIGRKILAVVRRGKFLWMPLESDNIESPIALVGHLGMSGQMLLRTPDFEPDKLTRVIISARTQDQQEVEFRFVDQRIFGSLAIEPLVATPDEKPGGYCPELGSESNPYFLNLIPGSAAHIARDLLDPNFNTLAVIARLRKKNTGIKRALLDQGLMSGIGNIYADEALWQAKVHYDQPASSLSQQKAKELIEAAQGILERAVRVGGTSFDEQYKNVNGESGYFAISLNAYGMTGKPCKRCGTSIKRDSWANRGSHFCPTCQKLR